MKISGVILLAIVVAICWLLPGCVVTESPNAKRRITPIWKY
jgi:hypothetical protein